MWPALLLTYLVSSRQYGPRDRLLLCRGASVWLCSGYSHKVLGGRLEVIVYFNSCLLSPPDAFLIQAGDNACQVLL